MDKIIGIEISLMYDDDSIEHEGYYRNIDEAIQTLIQIKEREQSEQNLSDI